MPGSERAAWWLSKKNAAAGAAATAAPANNPQREKTMTTRGMAATGPVPKRSDQRRRTNSPPTEKVPATKAPGTYKVPLADSEWHDLAKQWWQALRKSDQTLYYQPSDWAHAYAWTAMWSDQLETGKPSAMFLATWDSAMSRLLITEGDRRRVRIELERAGKGDPDKEHGVSSMESWRKKLAGGSA